MILAYTPTDSNDNSPINDISIHTNKNDKSTINDISIDANRQ